MVTNREERVLNRALLRGGALAAVVGVIAALVQTAIGPGMPDDPQEAIRKAAGSRLLASSRLLDMAAFLLLLVAVAVVAQTFSRERAGGWARAGLALFAVSAGAGAIATMVVGALTDVAHAWADAPMSLKVGYVATFDALNDVSGGIFAVSWGALSVFGVLYAAAILLEGTFPRWLAWVSVVSAVSIVTALALGFGFQLDVGFVFLVLGLLLFYVVIVTLGLRLWRLSQLSGSPADRPERDVVASHAP
jgi:hypothetical protein